MNLLSQLEASHDLIAMEEGEKLTIALQFAHLLSYCLVCYKWEEKEQVRIKDEKCDSIYEKLKFAQVNFVVFGCNVKV